MNLEDFVFYFTVRKSGEYHHARTVEPGETVGELWRETVMNAGTSFKISAAMWGGNRPLEPDHNNPTNPNFDLGKAIKHFEGFIKKEFRRRTGQEMTHLEYTWGPEFPG